MKNFKKKKRENEKAAGVNWEEQQKARKWVPLIPAIGLLLLTAEAESEG